jgi:hypothetical protein
VARLPRVSSNGYLPYGTARVTASVGDATPAVHLAILASRALLELARLPVVLHALQLSLGSRSREHPAYRA